MLIAVIGNFGKNTACVNGQTVKTIALYDELSKHYDYESISRINTAILCKKPINLFWEIFKAFRHSDNIIFLPANRAIKYFVPLFYILNLFYKRRIHYVVIGGWIGDFLRKNHIYKKMVDSFYMVYCETSVIKNELIGLGMSNNTILPNFKHIDIANISMEYSFSEPYKICTFTRVIKRKGILDIINAVKRINEKYGRIRYMLDIYGPVEEDFSQEFNNALEQSSTFCRYSGVIDPKQAAKTLQNYFLMVFPTRIKTEGHPGSIIDAFSAGVPVLSADWESSKDLINEKTGFLYEIGNEDALVDSLIEILDNPLSVIAKKEYCIRKAKEFDASNALKILVHNIMVD